MLSINTNLPSLIAQRSLNNSTKLLNQAIERMTTGFKINHAADNAANFSITTNMGVKLSSYEVAEDNVAMGLDLLSTAGGSLDLISDKLTRLRALAEQAANGTYGKQSLNAINVEAQALIDETNRIFNTTEYNGKKLFGHSGRFLEDVKVRDTSKMNTLESVDINTTITSGTYSISSAEELAKLATMANNGKIQGGEYVLANDIDLSDYSTGEGWMPIGRLNYTSHHFKGDFDGNGHIVSNLYINRPNSYSGLFGPSEGSIKNLGLENVNITGGTGTGGLVSMTMTDNQAGYTNVSLEISNCYVKNGQINGGGTGSTGGLIGIIQSANFIIESCYTDVDITGIKIVGGLLGSAHDNLVGDFIIKNSFALGDCTAKNVVAGGLIGSIYNNNVTLILDSCYATGNVLDDYTNASGDGVAGGLISQLYCDAVITNSYATGNVTAINQTASGQVGGFIGYINGSNCTIEHCYSTGDVSGSLKTGGFIGQNSNSANTTIRDCYSTGDINGVNYVGGFIGYNNSNSSISLENCYALGSISKNLDGTLIGYTDNQNININNCGLSANLNSLNKPICGTNLSLDNINNVFLYNGKVPFKIGNISVGLQVGINGYDTSKIDIETSFSLYGICDLYNLGLDDKDYLSKIDTLINTVSSKQTEFGAVENRLESALEEISTQYDNLVSSRSTLRDADIAEVSSEYIRQQILQQASATLLATANQSPALALQLI